MKYFLTISFSFFIHCGKAQFFDSLSTPGLWLRADQSKLSATGWSDVSRFNRHATALVGECPTVGSLVNFNKTVYFDGVNDYLQLPVNLEGLSELTILSVFHSADTTERGVWGTESFLSRNTMLTTRRATGPDTITDGYGKNENRVILSTIAQSWEGTTVKSANAFLALGSSGKTRGDKLFKGNVAELLVFFRSLAFLERLQIESYLALKYGTSMRGQNYISSDEKVLWKADENSAYSYHIAGMGRDDAFHLYQKQAQSAYDSAFLTLSVGPLASSNDENKAIIHHGDFLVWGDDNGSLIAKPGEGKDSVLLMMQRKWLMTATGNTAHQLDTELRVELSKFPKTTLGYWLVIDRTGEGNFSVDNNEYIFPDRMTPDGKVIYKIQWDTDRSGKDSFSFAQAKSLFAVARKLSDPLCTDETAGRVRIDIVAGKAPFEYTFTSPSNKISRQGKTFAKTFEQADLPKGDYEFTVKDNSGEALVRNFSLLMPDVLNISLGEDQKLVTGGEIVLDIKAQVPDAVAVSYLWENNFGFTSTESKVTITESGIYRVAVTRQSDGCSFSDEMVISGSEEQKFAVFPTIINRGEYYNVSVSMPEPGNVNVEVFDLKGMSHQTMRGENNSEYHFRATLGTSGMYLVVVRTAHGSESRKVIVN